ncbi:MAG TPA: VWA domain-containing protein [Vicinamibacterales bacterium]|nr:VWA domain-containing protein [Vicinamibacterales bacterium]
MSAQAPADKPAEAQQRPVFRGGTHFVRVDAYPIVDGRIVKGLQAADFEVFEDGKPQAIESFDYIEFEGLTPEAERRDPSSQRAGYDLAADPRYRVFVVYVDMALSKSAGPFAAQEDLPHIQQPLIDFFERVVGPRDLYGFVTTRNSVKDLVLAQKTAVTVSQIKDLWRASVIDRDEADEVLGFCDGVDITRADDPMKVRFRADATYTNLTDLVRQLGSVRQERKNLVLVTNLLPRWRPDPSLLDKRGQQMPRVGIDRGRVTGDDRQVVTNARGGNASGCAAEFQRLALMDFEPRFRELLQAAKRDNVSFYTITPGGLQAPPDRSSTRAMQSAYDDLRSLADETDGIAVTGTNDLNAGFKRIADDLAAYYVLGYYTTNTRFDGGLRNLRVRLTRTGQQVRARRQYRAPTAGEIAALAGSAARAAAPGGQSAVEAALAVLERGARPFAVYAAMAPQQMTVVAELSAASIAAGKWKEGADVEVDAVAADGVPIARARGRLEPGAHSTAVAVPLPAAPSRVAVRLVSPAAPPADDWAKLPAARRKLIADPIAYRSSSRIATRPVAAFEFARNERIRVEWPVLSSLDRRDVRLLDRSGKPIPVGLPLAEDVEKKQLVLEMSLSGLGRGDYLFELTAGSGEAVERSLLAIRIRP